MYHHISPLKGDMITVTPEVFEAQLRHVASGYRAITLDEAVDFISGGFNPPEKCVVLTFDDCYLDNYVHAWPLLKKYGIKAAIFTVTSWADKASLAPPGAVSAAMDECRRNPVAHAASKAIAGAGEYHRVAASWDMIKEMRSGNLVDFYSHTATHRSCDVLTQDELGFELGSSRAALERELGTSCKYLCWPKGRYTEAAVKAAQGAGYSALFTTRHGVIKPGDDLLSIKRVVVKDDADWLKLRLRIYCSPLLSGLYLKVKKR